MFMLRQLFWLVSTQTLVLLQQKSSHKESYHSL